MPGGRVLAECGAEVRLPTYRVLRRVSFMINFGKSTDNSVLQDVASMLYANSLAGQNMVSCISWYGVVRYITVRYSTMRCGTAWYGVVWHDTVMVQ